MRTRFFVWIFLVVFFQLGFVGGVMGQHTISDTIIANRLLLESIALSESSKFDSAQIFIRKSISIFSNLFGENCLQIANCKRLLGRCFQEQGKLDSSIVCYSKSQNIFNILDTTIREVKTNYGLLIRDIGVYHGIKGSTPLAIEYLNNSLRIFTENEDLNNKEVASIYNGLGLCNKDIGNYDLAIQFLNKSLQIIKDDQKENYRELGTIYNNLGSCYRAKPDLDQAILCDQKALFYKIEFYGERHPAVAMSYNNLADRYNAIGDYEKAIECNQKALSIKLEKIGEKHYSTGNSYSNLGKSLLNKGEYRASLLYLKKALICHQTSLGEDHRRVASDHYNLGEYYLNIDRLDIAIEYFHKSMAIMKKLFGDKNPDIYTHYLMIAECYLSQNDHNRAYEYLTKGTEILSRHNAEHPDMATCYSLIADYYWRNFDTLNTFIFIDSAINHFSTNLKSNLNIRAGYMLTKSVYLNKLHNFNESVSLLKNCEEIYLNINNYKNNNLAKCQIMIAENYLILNDKSNFNKYIKKALKSAGLEGWDIEKVNSFTVLINAIILTNTAFPESANRTNVKDSFDDNRYPWIFYDKVIQTARNSTTINSEKEHFQQSARRGYEFALYNLYRTATLSDSLYDAFLYAEKTKSLLLYEASQETNALHFSGISDSLLDREYNLRVDIAYYDQKRFEIESKGTSPTDSALLTLQSRSFDLHQQYEALKKTFETDYPDYYRLKYDLRVEDVAAVQRDLLYPDMALVEYFVGDSAVYIFTIRKQDYSVLEVKKDFPLEQWVAQLRRGMTGFNTDPDMALKYDSLSALYTEAASNIYEKLVAPIAAKLPAKVIFIPDGVLGYVPFEALLVEKPDNPTRWPQHHYLLNDHSVSYCYSATMLREMLYRKHQQQPALGFLGFAPAYDGDTTLLDSLFRYDDGMRKDLKPLHYSGEEVYRVAKMMKGQAVVGPAASRTAFTEQAGRARILHLATHGQANDRAGDYCFLVFADQKDSAENEPLLYARDIYNLQLNADLVTLSACETGIGELQGSEGIISLARAFAYAGAKSIVTSLWSVSDAKTKDLMIDFYKNLRKGMLKDDALRQAKLDFLKRNRSQEAHPFFWAGFVGIGNMGRVK